ncbi:hypothetical protein CR513_04488, partial [Mucuna pruriens]
MKGCQQVLLETSIIGRKRELEAEKLRERSRSRQYPNTSYRGTITTISGGGTFDERTVSAMKRHSRGHHGYPSLKECSGTLFRFAREQVEIRGTVEIEVVSGVGPSARTILVSYTFVNTWAFYNMIIGRHTLYRLRAVVSTLHLCMKCLVGKECYEDNLRVGRRPISYDGANNSQAFVNFLDLDPRQQLEDRKPRPTKDLKEVRISPSRM